MRSFIASAILIALVLIGQQWMARSSEAAGLSANTPTTVTLK